MSDEDNNHDTNYINKFHDANHDTRKLHMWAQDVESAVSVLFWSCVIHTSLAQVVLESSLHPIFMHERLSLTSPSSFSTSTCPPPVFFHSSVLMHPEPHTDLDNLNTEQHNLRHSVKGSKRRLRRHQLPHRLWAQRHDLQRARQLPVFLVLRYPVIGPGHRRHYARQAAHRRTPIIRRLPQSGRCVCQSVSRRRLLCSIEQGNLWEKELSISQLVLVSREIRTVLTASFLKTPKLRKWSIEQGNLWEKAAQTHRLGPCLMNRDKWLSQNTARKLVITNFKQLEQKKNAEFYKKNYGVCKKDFREVHQPSLTEMEELRKFQSSTFDTIARRKLIEDQNTIMELSGRVQELQNEVNCVNDSKDFQDAESVRSGNSHVTNQPMLFPKHPIPEGMLRPSFIRIAAPQRRAAKHLGYTWYIGKRFCKSTCFLFSSLSSRIKFYLEENYWGTASYVYSGEKWTKPRSEMPVWTVSQRFSHLQWRRLFKELWGRPTTTAEFGSSFWQIPYASNLCLL